MIETWTQIINYGALYEVSNLGRVKSLPKLKHTPHGGKFLSKEKIMKLSRLNNGYLIVTLSNNKRQRKFLLHRLVAEHFIANPLSFNEVNHIDGIKTNNSSTNLEWCSHSHNIIHALNTGLISKNKRRKVPV